MLLPRLLFPLAVLLPVLAGLAAWVGVDRAVGGIAPYSVVRDAIARRSDLLSAPLRWLRPGPSQLNAAAQAAWQPPKLTPLSRPAEHPVRDVAGLRAALVAARSDEAIELAPGDYLLDEPLVTGADGWQGGPIRLRGQPGSRIVVRQGAHALALRHAWWVVEGLRIEGRCEPKLRCEAGLLLNPDASHARLHALHIANFGSAVRVLRGNGTRWADHGVLSSSLMRLDSPFPTPQGGQALDLQGASHWTVTDNRVFGIGKPGNRSVAYGVLAKGGGEGLRVERNLFVCSPDAAAFKGAGAQLAVGFGGASTSAQWLRNPDQGFEQQHARVAHNVVANCSDAAIDVYRSRDIKIQHNTLLSSGGIQLRGAGAEAEVRLNLTSGAWYPQRGSVMTGGFNRRWAPASADLGEALTEARALAPTPGASAPAGADTRWLAPVTSP